MVSIYDRQNETAYEQLKYRLAINDLGSARSLLLWDQQTYMPRGAVAGRAEQVATLSRLSLEMLVNEATARLLDSVGEPNPSSEEGRSSGGSDETTLKEPEPKGSRPLLATSTNPPSRLGAARGIDAKRPPYARR